MSTSSTARKSTRERILDTALILFNEEGEPNVTTNAIADEMDISPGNLHYHYKTKSDLVEALFRRFEREVSALFSSVDHQEIDIVEAWMKITLLFEIVWAHRFAYRDLAQLQSKYPNIKRDTARLLHQKISVVEQGCAVFGIEAGTGESEALARNLVVVITYWLSFEIACGVAGEDRNRFARGAYQVTSMLLPHLDEDAREIIRNLAGKYL